MKRLLFSLTLFCLLFSAIGCLKDQCSERRTFVRFDPVYRSSEQLDAPLSVEAPRALRSPGIVYVYKDLILVNEFRKGIHIIDNTDPENPFIKTFIDLEGNEHFAVSHDQIQANKFNTLVTIDISDPENPTEMSRIKEAFDPIYEHPGRGFLVYYRETDQTVTLDCSEPNFNSLRWSEQTGGPIFIRFDALNANASGVDQGNAGVGGSTARFTIVGDYLYAVSEFDLKVFSLKEPARPVHISEINIGWGIETIYPFKDKLFIGSNSGMFVYDISDPARPHYVSSFEHARACDPVISDGNTAYVTLRDGTTCEGFNNQLDVIDVTNMSAPYLVKTYQMDHPIGLVKYNNTLYICEDEGGVKVLDATDRENIKEIHRMKEWHAYDIIALSKGRLLVIGNDGLVQWDITKEQSPVQLSYLPVIRD
jgi:hypothetical protein